MFCDVFRFPMFSGLELFLDENIANNNLAKTALVYHAIITALSNGQLNKNDIPLDDLTRQLLKHL